MQKKRPAAQPPFAYASPWLLAGAIGLLLVIAVFFGVNNLQRGKRLMTESLFNKGQAIIRLVGAGARASWMMGASMPQQLQHLMEQSSGDASILSLAVVNGQGTILAHSAPELVSTTVAPPDQTAGAMPRLGMHRVTEVGGKSVFEVIAPFRPFMRGRGHFMRHPRDQFSPPPKAGPGQTGAAPPCQPTGGGMPGSWMPDDKNLFIVVGLDMTEQKQAERQDIFHLGLMSVAMLLVAIGGWSALLTAQRYRSSQKTIDSMQAFTDLLIGRLPVGIIATNNQGLIQTFNSTAARLTGVQKEAAIGKAPQEAMAEPFSQLFDMEDGEVLREVEFAPQSEKGQPTQLLLSSLPIRDGANNPIGRVALLSDLSELKRLEAQVRRQERLVALGKMAAGVAHEVRNPLSSIKGFATLLGSRFKEESEERQAATLMANEVERLNRSITELLTYARPLPLELREIAARPFIEASLKLIESDATALGVTLSAEILPEDRMIQADQDRLNQVLLNLYLNSLQAMENGGKLRVTVRDGEQPGWAEIVVRDTGRGIPAELVDRVLDPYFTTKPDGTGLGLAMVHKIVEEHGGAVRIASQEGEGATVTVVLPNPPTPSPF
ncbi:MAG: two-component system sensor histidine kinase NtrB [Thermodesulfobacteriota bacterium]